MDGITATTEHEQAGTQLAHIKPDQVCPEFVKRVPISFARQFSVLGLRSDSGPFEVALASSESLHAVDKISVLLGTPARPVIASSEQILRAINLAYGEADSGVEEVIEDLGSDQIEPWLEVVERGGDLLDPDQA